MNRRWMAWDAAVMTVRQIGITSRDKYRAWWDENKPIGLPKYPNRVYPQWTTWGNFLGVENSFSANHKRVYRPFWEAVRYVHSLGIKSVQDYKKMHKEGKIPLDIPRSPETQYKADWQGYNHFLGIGARKIIDAAKHNVAVWAVCDVGGMPGGYVRTLLCEEGFSALKEKVEREGITRVYKVYKWDVTKAENVRRVMSQYGRQTDQPGIWLIGNLPGLISDLYDVLDYATIPQS